jgi:hypothetical protein
MREIDICEIILQSLANEGFNVDFQSSRVHNGSFWMPVTIRGKAILVGGTSFEAHNPDSFNMPQIIELLRSCDLEAKQFMVTVYDRGRNG